MKTRIAFAGFRHAHIFDLLAGVEEREDAEVAAIAEEDESVRDALKARGITVTHANYEEMLREVDCDAIAIGDCYGRRGPIAIAALKMRRHVISDKPLCTRYAEEIEIARLVLIYDLKVGLQLDSRDAASFRTARTIVKSGEIGEVCTMRIDGQHPLLLGTRPDWYFEPDQHGGTINDIGIHAFDFVPWMTGLSWDRISAARSWNAKARLYPHFEDCAQMMAVLENGAGVLADFSYVAPDKLGYRLPNYWRLTIHGTRGLLETHLASETVTVITDSSEAPSERPVEAPRRRGYLDDFIRQVQGRGNYELSSDDCLRATRYAMKGQALAKR